MQKAWVYKEIRELRNDLRCQAWWSKLVILVLRGQRKDDYEFEVSLISKAKTLSQGGGRGGRGGRGRRGGRRKGEEGEEGEGGEEGEEGRREGRRGRGRRGEGKEEEDGENTKQKIVSLKEIDRKGATFELRPQRREGTKCKMI